MEEAEPLHVSSPITDQTFRVYTPEELRNVTLRPSHLPSARFVATEPEDKTLRPTTLAKYMAIGFAATMVLFTGFIVVTNAFDDSLAPSKSVADYGNANATSTTSPTARTTTASGIGMTTPLPSIAAPAGTSDFELPDDTTPVQRTAGVKNVKPKQGKRSIRSNP